MSHMWIKYNIQSAMWTEKINIESTNMNYFNNNSHTLASIKYIFIIYLVDDIYENNLVI